MLFKPASAATGEGRDMAAKPCAVSLWALGLLFLAGIIQSLLPPLQSPDEFAHLVRAYSLYSGDFVMRKPPDQAYAGVAVDAGLVSFFQAYESIPYNAENRLSRQVVQAGEQIRWQGVSRFSAAPGAAYNMPLVYFPQASGLWLGKILDLSVAHSYWLARLFALLAALGLVALALAQYPANPLLLGLLVMPMSLVQWASPSLDGISVGLALLCCALFMRLMRQPGRPAPHLLWGLALALLLLTTCRVHLLPLLLLPGLVALVRRDRTAWLLFGATSVLALAWTGLAVSSSYIARATPGMSTSAVVAHYLAEPGEFFGALLRTWANADMRRFYLQSFIGILGWLDTPLGSGAYRVLASGLCVLAGLAVSLRRQEVGRLCLGLMAGFSLLIVFLALLVTWNPLAPTVIEGVQGRYFTIPLVLLSYALAGSAGMGQGWRQRLAAVGVIALALISLFVTSRAVLERYYLAPVPVGTAPSVFTGQWAEMPAEMPANSAADEGKR